MAHLKQTDHSEVGVAFHPNNDGGLVISVSEKKQYISLTLSADEVMKLRTVLTKTRVRLGIARG